MMMHACMTFSFQSKIHIVFKKFLLFLIFQKIENLGMLHLTRKIKFERKLVITKVMLYTSNVGRCSPQRGLGISPKRGLRSIEIPPILRWCPTICIKVWWELEEAQYSILMCARFHRHHLLAIGRRFCMQGSIVPFQMTLSESFDVQAQILVLQVHKAYPNTTKQKKQSATPLWHRSYIYI